MHCGLIYTSSDTRARAHSPGLSNVSLLSRTLSLPLLSLSLTSLTDRKVATVGLTRLFIPDLRMQPGARVVEEEERRRKKARERERGWKKKLPLNLTSLSSSSSFFFLPRKKEGNQKCSRVHFILDGLNPVMQCGCDLPVQSVNILKSRITSLQFKL